MDNNNVKSGISEKLFTSPKTAWFWLVVRIYVGWIWFTAGLDKIRSEAWTGDNAGTAISGFVKRAIEKAEGPNPDVQAWYAFFLEKVVLECPVFWSHLVAWGEFLVGIALLLGALTVITAFFSLVMNFSFLMAGSVGINPVMIILGAGLILARKVSGNIGADGFLIPALKKRFYQKKKPTKF